MNSQLSIAERVQKAADFLRGHFETPPQFGIVLGTGSGVLAEMIECEHRIDYQQIPNFPQSTAMGHAGSMVCGTLSEQPVIAMNGRFHLYEGHALDDATIAIRVMHALGVKYLFITNASGGINPKFSSGDIMLIQSHIDLMCRVSADASVGAIDGRPELRTDRYDLEMAKLSHACARQNDFVLQAGVYGGLLGPNYETRAEYRMLRRIGADVAGMSTVPEVHVAAKLGLKILGLSVVTNVAKPDVLAETTGQEVIDAAELAAPRVYMIVESVIQHLAG